MKKYEKPILTAITLSGNDQLCGHCADQGGIVLKDKPNVAVAVADKFGINLGDNGPDASDFANLFGMETECGFNPKYTGACKFTSQGMLLAWS